jgi:hypothetical protein
MSFPTKTITKTFLVASLVLTGNTVNALQQPIAKSIFVTNAPKISLLQTDNKPFETRIDALNAVKDRGSIPRSLQFVSQWENGNDTSRAASTGNYVLEKTRQASWGNYYLYKVGSGYFVVAEHINDPAAPCPVGWTKPCKHFHVGNAPSSAATSFAQSKTPDAAAVSYFKSTDYVQVGGAHHYFYKK